MSMYPIASQTMTNSSTQFVTFTSIPQTFTHLQIRAYSRATIAGASDYIAILWTGASAYTNHSLYGNGASILSTGNTATFGTGMGAIPAATSTAGLFGVMILDMLEYTNSNKLKPVRAISGWDNNSAGNTYLSSGMDTSTTAVPFNISIFTGSTFATGSRFDLYGIGVSNATGA